MIAKSNETNYQFLRKLELDGTLQQLLNRGFVSTKINFFKQIFEKVELIRTIDGKTKTDAIYETAELFKISERTVERAITAMK